MDAVTVMGVLALACWLSALMQLALVERRLGAAVPVGRKTYDTRLWLNTALPIVLVWGMYTLLTSTDVIVLKIFQPAEEVAHYYAAAKTLALVSIIQYAVAAASAHHFTAYHVAGDRAGLVAFAAGTVRWVFWPSLAGCLAMLILGKPVLGLFGAGFRDGYPVIAVLAVGQLARACVGPAERLLNMLGQQRTCALAYAAAFAVNLLGCFLLAPMFGGIGVASATAAAFVVESVLLFLIARRRLGLHMFIWRPRTA
jgi:O-antigen/teichoic acid export membrane protein